APQLEHWTELIAEGDGVLTGVHFADDKLILNYNVDASNRLYVYTRTGELVREMQLPTYGSASVSSSKKHNEVFYAFTSFTYPTVIYRYDLESGESTLYKAVEIEGFNMDDYVTEQVFYPSADGTKIPMFLTYKKGLERNGKNPVYLYGYGGFNISLNPGFSAQRILWLENGGIYAQTNLRGGGEYGEEWHLAGTKMNKLNVFNDFISAAEHLIGEGFTSKDKIVIEGGSNGGLLVGACVNMRPDLFKVAIPRVGVMDMMRYHLFTIGWNWAADYGTSADSKEMAEYLLEYSPMHNIKNDGTQYPAIMVTTADHDDRVVPAHSFKYAAALQAANTGDAPKIIRIDSKAGHGAGKPITKVIDEYTDIYSFIFYNLGIEPSVE
ncbi:MAG: S9 family peptidase, partial [Muribaculaceae bacterium]|nr:S9 family peptidase [Muribaculaceae bacterium]